MSKVCFCVFIILSVFLCGILFCVPLPNESTTYNRADFLRIHIRANSNDSADQNVKYLVKNQIVDEMNELLANSRTKQEAIENISNNLSKIINVANSVLIDNGFSYGCNAKINKEKFPTRYYDDVVLEAGIYDALIINLGSGKGDNWWCVVYPPLCFVDAMDNGNNNIVYRSKLLEIINDFFDKFN